MHDYELQALTRLREEVPLAPVSARAAHLFHSSLEQRDAGKTAVPRTGPRARLRRARPPWWPAVAVGLTGVLAAGAGAAIVLSTRPAAPGAGVITVAELAYRTSAAAARQPDVGPHQWVYREVVQYGGPPGMGETPEPSTSVRWATADDRTNAFFYHGRLVVGPWAAIVTWRGGTTRMAIPAPPVSYASLGSLPADPRALVSRLDSGYPAVLHGWHAFTVIATLLSSYVMPPRLAAEMYRALGAIPGVTVDDHAVDVAGKPGIGFLVHIPRATGTAARFRLEIVVSPRTYQFIGFQNSGGQPGRPTGVAVVRQALVPRPGVRPLPAVAGRGCADLAY